MSMKSQMEKAKEDLRKRAIDYVMGWAENRLKSYEEPSRAGTAKGDPIGLSAKKYHASLLMILHPNALELKDIAKICDVSFGVLRVWRTEAAFKLAVDGAVEEFWSKLLTVTVDALENKKRPYGDPVAAVVTIFSLLPFLDSAIAKNFSVWAWEKRDQYAWVYDSLVKTLYVTDPKSAKDFFIKNKEIFKPLIMGSLHRLSDTKAWEKYGPEYMKELSETLSSLITIFIDILTE